MNNSDCCIRYGDLMEMNGSRMGHIASGNQTWPFGMEKTTYM